VTLKDQARIVWRGNAETRDPYARMSPDVDRLQSLEFPPPWPARPWTYANVITSKNNVVTWTPKGHHDDPIRAIAGGDVTRAGRLADVRLLHCLRACADAVCVGAQTFRDHPELMEIPAELGRDLPQTLSHFRQRDGRRRFPLLVVYSESGRLNLDAPIFNAPEPTAIIVTTDTGARRLRSRGDEQVVTILIAGEERIESKGLLRSHERLFAEFGVRYLDCEGGMVALSSLHRAGVLDEIFVTVTDVHIEPTEHEGIQRLFPLEGGGARLIVEGRTADDAGYVFRRWRFNER
jgi:riboflavin biosynthesis pyrimidine reductase